MLQFFTLIELVLLSGWGVLCFNTPAFGHSFVMLWRGRSFAL